MVLVDLLYHEQITTTTTTTTTATATTTSTLDIRISTGYVQLPSTLHSALKGLQNRLITSSRADRLSQRASGFSSFSLVRLHSFASCQSVLSFLVRDIPLWLSSWTALSPLGVQGTVRVTSLVVLLRPRLLPLPRRRPIRATTCHRPRPRSSNERSNGRSGRAHVLVAPVCASSGCRLLRR